MYKAGFKGISVAVGYWLHGYIIS